MQSGGTFSRTELRDDSPRDRGEKYKLPASVNYVSLRESFISDAPFVKRANATFWRFNILYVIFHLQFFGICFHTLLSI